MKKSFGVRLDPDLIKKLESESVQNDWTISHLVNRIISQYFKKNKKDGRIKK